MSPRYMENLKWKLSFGNGIFMDQKGMGGGLTLLWKDHIDVSLYSFSSHHIGAEIIEEVVLISGVSLDSMVTHLIRIELGTFSELWLKNPLCPGYILVISMKLLVVMGKKVVCFARLLRKMLTLLVMLFLNVVYLIWVGLVANTFGAITTVITLGHDFVRTGALPRFLGVICFLMLKFITYFQIARIIAHFFLTGRGLEI